jgi:NAD-specific glutamate dehydrogenase
MNTTGSSARVVAHTHFGLAARLGLDWLHAAIERLPGNDEWQRSARNRLQQAARAAHLRLTAAALRPARTRRGRERSAGRASATGSGMTFMTRAAAQPALQRWQGTVSDLQALQAVEVPALIVALQTLEELAGGRAHGPSGLL